MYRSIGLFGRRFTPLLPTGYVGSLSASTSEKVDAFSVVSKNDKIKKINRAMLAYLEEAKARDAFMKRESAEYELGKRHLANMMGMDAQTMTKQDVNDAVEYLFPSALFSKLACPMMKPPEDLYPQQKPVQFDENGRPYHSMFYTLLPNFYQILYEVREKILRLQAYEDRQFVIGASPPTEKVLLTGSDWLTAEQLSMLTLERVSEEHHAQLVAAGEDLVSLPYSYLEADFIRKLRAPIGGQVGEEMDNLRQQVLATVTVDESGRKTATATGYKKRIACTVKVTDGGSGKITIDGLTLEILKWPQSRENVLFPFILLNRLGQFDVESTHLSLTGQTERDPFALEPRGETVVTAATRHGISLALLAFVSTEEAEKLRLAGLLTRDPRRRERKKIGQPGARAKWTWRKR